MKALQLPTLTGNSAASSAGAALAASAPMLKHKARCPEVSQRQAFLQSLLNEDLQSLSAWHGTRPTHEQRRFLKSVDTLYKALEVTEGGSALQAAAADRQRRQQFDREQAAEAQRMDAAAAAAAESDPLNGPPRTPRAVDALGRAASEPCLVPAKPIEVFEARKRQGYNHGGEEATNSLDLWLDGQSITTGTTGTTATTASSGRTRFSQMTRTSNGSGSLGSAPGTINQATFRTHRRARAVNRLANVGSSATYNAGNLKDLGSGFPEMDRMQTEFRNTYGSKPQEGTITKNMYSSVISGDAQPFVAQFLERAPPDQRDRFATMARSLEYLRQARLKEGKSLARQDFDLEENRRLWKPPQQKPVLDPSQRNHSQVPIGSRQPIKENMTASAPQLLADVSRPPPSPTVSGLGSLPLSRSSTPLQYG